MKFLFNAMSSVIFLISFPALISAQECNDLEGAWLMIYTEYSSADTTYEYTEFESDRIKVLGGNHFTFGFQGYQGDPDFAYAGGGRYEYTANEYTETIHYHSAAGNVGSTITFDCRVDGDRWCHEGILPTSRIFDDKVRIREIWRRINQ